MEENILRIVQLALAINRTNQGDESFVRCIVSMEEDRRVTVKVTEYKKMCPLERFPKLGELYHPTPLMSYYISPTSDCDISQYLKPLENICESIGIDTSERYIKVKVC